MELHRISYVPARETGRLDAGADLVVGSCSCGEYMTAPSTRPAAEKAAAAHVRAKTGKRPLVALVIETRHPEDWTMVNREDNSRWVWSGGRWTRDKRPLPAEEPES